MVLLLLDACRGRGKHGFLQSSAKQLPGAVETGENGSDGDVEQFGDFAACVAFQKDHEKGFADARGEGIEGNLQCLLVGENFQRRDRGWRRLGIEYLRGVGGFEMMA